ncbi:hypothetical protein Ccrd_013169 [Cynara cardunculus var. scolymus]|uniref:Uncharacterized protein n=1 Tax=Cynara cardunculus var. scolymus TaxID=59895 RepID=A0A118K533_CYNCS|nr:hypothetical protein Ccrd_013169 [Cynara cardunculus var. scolymus]
MANGGVIAPVGLNMVALVAQGHVVPFVVLASIHKGRRSLGPQVLKSPTYDTPDATLGMRCKSRGNRVMDPMQKPEMPYSKPDSRFNSQGLSPQM